MIAPLLLVLSLLQLPDGFERMGDADVGLPPAPSLAKRLGSEEAAAWLAERFPAARLDLTRATSDGRKAFVPDPASRSVTAVDLWNRRELATTQLDGAPGEGAVLPGDIEYAVCVAGANVVALINTASHRVVAAIDGVVPAPALFQVEPTGRFAFVGGAGAELGVIDLAQRRVVGELELDAPPIHLGVAPSGAPLVVGLEGGARLAFRLPQPPRLAPLDPDRKTEVFVMGMIHDGHLTSERWGLQQVEETIRRIDPDVIACEIPPDRWEAALADWREHGEIREPRVARFAEYTGVLFPLLDELGFVVEPAAAWTTEMNDLRNARIATFEGEAEHAAENAAYQELRTEIAAQHAEDPLDSGDPRVIHSDAYDERTEEALAPYDTFLNDWIGPGGWTHINRAHAALVEAALDRHPGKRVLVTFGASHKYWLRRQLGARPDVRMMDVRPYLPSTDMRDRCVREVQDLHRFFQEWFQAELPDTDEAYARFERAMGQGFHIITPEGRTVERADLVRDLRAAHGSRADPAYGYAIRVENVEPSPLGDGHWLVRYEEWQDLTGETTGRVSTGVLTEDKNAPGGFTWRHVHETWLP